MRRQPLSALFALFFNPAVPVAFVIGSIALSLLSSALYQLLVESLGGVAYGLWYILLGAAAIFAVAVLGLWLWLRSQPLRRVTVVPREREAVPHAGLILCVSPGEIRQGNERHAVERHGRDRTLRHCWLIVSPAAQGKAQELDRLIRSSGATPYLLPVDNEREAALSYSAVERALEAALALPDCPSVVVDITGGTRPMAAGAVIACRDYGVPMEYVLGQYDQGKLDPNVAPQVMNVDLM